MNRLKPFVKIVSFLVMICIVLFVLSYMAKPDGPNLDNMEGLYGEEKNSIDVVVIGGSVSFVSYAPLKSWSDSGIVSYDYGVNNIQAESYEPMIEEVLKTQNPKLIIIDARAFQYRDANVPDSNPPGEVSYRNVLTGMRFSKNKCNFINNYVEREINDNKLSYYFDIIKYHDNVFCANKNNIEMMVGKYKNPFRGFYFIPKVKKINKYDFSTDKRKKTSKSTNSVLVNLINHIKKKNINCLFVVEPYAEKKSHKMIYNYIQDEIENRGYHFLDCNEHISEMNLDYSNDFYDENHVNIFGAEKYTDFLNQYILKNYSIPNRKNDANYSFMNKYLADWDDTVKSTKADIKKINEVKQNEQ